MTLMPWARVCVHVWPTLTDLVLVSLGMVHGSIIMLKYAKYSNCPPKLSGAK